MGHTSPLGYWGQSPEALLTALQSSDQGLSAAMAQERLAKFGPNTLKAERRASALTMFLGQFKNAIVLILVFATIVSAITKDWVDALIILGIVLGSAILSFVQEYRAKDAADKLRERVQTKAKVIRDGLTVAIPADEVVPGDVVLLSAGSLVPADSVLLEAHDLYVNQAVLTGETFPVEKSAGVIAPDARLPERTNCVFMGTSVRSGAARALVVVTGAATEFGQIAKRLSTRPPETEFERGIRRFGYLLTEIMLVLVLVIFAANVFFQKPVLDSLLFSVALAVGLTPQLLPAITTITLSRGSQIMAAKGVIVRRLESIENFGSMDTLCTDKTGTLTQGVVKLDGATDVTGEPSPSVLRYAFLNAKLQTGLTNPLDEAILAQAQPDLAGVVKLGEVPYDFQRKRLSVVVAEEGGQALLITKGALEPVLNVCTRIAAKSGVQPLDASRRQEALAYLAAWSERGFRVLGVATRVMPAQASYTRADETNLTFAGFLLFFDPPKPGVKETVADLEALGVQIKIISGDNRLVGLHTAQVIGLPVAGVLTGDEIAAMHDEALWQAAERTTLFMEVDPNEKERIILALKKMGHVVGYMGDGINDAPALHAADVGISVDSAVDVAKEAADFVLLQRDLAVLREGIVEGRRTFANTLKYVFITTSANFGNMLSMAGASLFMPFLPMLPKQILLTNFLTDFPAVTIAQDSVDREMVERPHRWNIRFIRSFMVTFGLVSSVFDYLTFGVLLRVLQASEAQFQSGWFIESVVTELLILLVIRTQKPFFRSRPANQLLIGVVLVMAVTMLLPYTALAQPLGLVPLPPRILLLLGAITLGYLAASEVAKRFFYRHARL